MKKLNFIGLYVAAAALMFGQGQPPKKDHTKVTQPSPQRVFSFTSPSHIEADGCEFHNRGGGPVKRVIVFFGGKVDGLMAMLLPLTAYDLGKGDAVMIGQNNEFTIQPKTGHSFNAVVAKVNLYGGQSAFVNEDAALRNNCSAAQDRKQLRKQKGTRAAIAPR